ncbi:hypothetical protein CHARACLAT_019123 [Characodon lateralis]|uniref:Uncharacterized protein n=1 Tax=Characodon lateralis TaxID=208331 RepID=A0ABU7EAY4_9TELE|nr:hypothetical protein [Characodon lateralis]
MYTLRSSPLPHRPWLSYALIKDIRRKPIAYLLQRSTEETSAMDDDDDYQYQLFLKLMNETDDTTDPSYVTLTISHISSPLELQL